MRSFHDTSSVLAYLQDICAFYPEPMITLSSTLAVDGALTPLNALRVELKNGLTVQGNGRESKAVREFLIAMNSINLSSYSLPMVRNLPSVPTFRRQKRFDLGSSANLSSVTTLLYRMRQQEAIWQEMGFLYLDVDRSSRSILVVENGRIVNGLGVTAGYAAFVQEQNEGDYFEDEEAFWEGLTQDLAGLLAIHHLEDIVVVGPRKEAVIERFEDRYQFYDFPHSPCEQEGFEAAIGAAIIAEGLYSPGLAAEIVERLQLSQLKSCNRLLQFATT